MLNKSVEIEGSSVIFDDNLLQVIMGQWLGIIPSSIQKGNLFSHYKQPQEAIELLNRNEVSKQQLEQIELQFMEVLKLFGLEDDRYFIKDFNRENHTFHCILLNKEETASIQYIFGNFITFPSEFIVDYNDVISTYHFITDPRTSENILIAIQNQTKEFKEDKNVSFYRIEDVNQSFGITVEYFKQLTSLDELSSVIDTDRLAYLLDNSNFLQQSFIEISQILGECLKKDLSFYRQIQLESIQDIEGNQCRNRLILSHGKIQELVIANHPASLEKRSEIVDIFTTENKDIEIRKKHK